MESSAEPGPILDPLMPENDPIEPDPHEAQLRRIYAYPPPTRGPAVVRTTMVSSIDGGAWGPDHRSGTVNDAADMRVFAVLRSLADVVLIGAGTARAESYTALTVDGTLAEHREAPLTTAVVTVAGHVPSALQADDRPTLVLTGEQGARAAHAVVGTERTIVVGPAPDDAHAPRSSRPLGGIDLGQALCALADRGLGRVLCEGGPTLLGSLLAADLVDELCLTQTPTLVGPGPGRIVAGQTGETLPVRPARLDHLLHANGTILTRWTVPIGWDT